MDGRDKPGHDEDREEQPMSRRHSAEKREINPDAKYGNLIVSKFMNSIMYEGKKSVAEAIVYGALSAIEGKTKSDPIKVFEQALGIRWIISAARERNEKTMTERLSAELLDASNSRGNAVKKREDTHRMAEANRAFSHYRW